MSMTPTSKDYVRDLLVWLASSDGRVVTEEMILEWHDRLRHLDAEVTRQAVEAARANRTIDVVKPAHVLAHAEAIERQSAASARAATVNAKVYGTAPKPANFEALAAAAASGDPIAIAREKAVYNRQLIDGGYAPLYEVGDER